MPGEALGWYIGMLNFSAGSNRHVLLQPSSFFAHVNETRLAGFPCLLQTNSCLRADSRTRRRKTLSDPKGICDPAVADTYNEEKREGESDGKKGIHCSAAWGGLLNGDINQLLPAKDKIWDTQSQHGFARVKSDNMCSFPGYF